MAYLAKKDRDAIKHYLIGCEYMQIDPSKAHDVKFMEERAEHVLREWDDIRSEEAEDLRTALGKYMEMMNGKVPVTMKITEGMRTSERGAGPQAFRREPVPDGVKPSEYYFDTLTIPEQFADRCAKLISEGKLEVLPHTVSETYTKKELRHDNYDKYFSTFPKWPN